MLSYPTNARDFSYRRSGSYTNARPLARPRFVASVRRDAGWGGKCPACGLLRSRANACECNS
jgi:hypothetical protein